MSLIILHGAHPLPCIACSAHAKSKRPQRGLMLEPPMHAPTAQIRTGAGGRSRIMTRKSFSVQGLKGATL
jgi:hypothetical protein